jgi:hypothetical protein
MKKWEYNFSSVSREKEQTFAVNNKKRYGYCPEREIIRAIRIERICSVFDETLNETDSQILKMIFGFVDGWYYSSEEIGLIYNKDEKWVNGRKRASLRRLKNTELGKIAYDLHYFNLSHKKIK